MYLVNHILHWYWHLTAFHTIFLLTSQFTHFSFFPFFNSISPSSARSFTLFFFFLPFINSFIYSFEYVVKFSSNLSPPKILYFISFHPLVHLKWNPFLTHLWWKVVKIRQLFWLYMFACICPYVVTQEPVNGLSWSITLRSWKVLLKCCWHVTILAEIEKNNTF